MTLFTMQVLSWPLDPVRSSSLLLLTSSLITAFPDSPQHSHMLCIELDISQIRNTLLPYWFLYGIPQKELPSLRLYFLQASVHISPFQRCFPCPPYLPITFYPPSLFSFSPKGFVFHIYHLDIVLSPLYSQNLEQYLICDSNIYRWTFLKHFFFERESLCMSVHL